MANEYIDTALLDRAICFAVRAHHDTERRGKGFPYIVHPMEAVAIVATMTSDQELLAAAALHDVVEDTDVTVGDIRREFGDRIAGIVESESDKSVEGRSESATWRERKQAAIDRLAGVSRDAKIVALGDKLSNMRAISRDYDVLGDRLWDRFHAPGGRADHEWHYRGLAASLNELSGTHAYAEFVWHIEHVFGKSGPEPVDLADYTVSGDGHTAVSYNHKDGARMMKLYAGFVPDTVPERELHTNWAVLNLGIRVPRAIRLVTDGQRSGVEFERIAGKRSIARAISQEPERLEEYTAEFARQCKALHATSCYKDIFPPARERFRSAIDRSSGFDAAEKARLRAFVDAVPEAGTCLHGDLHIGNMIVADGNSWWIDLADFSFGDPRFDLGMLYFCCHADNDAEAEQQIFHLSLAQLQAVWDVFVRTYYGPDADPDAVGREIAPFAALYMIDFANRETMFPRWRDYIAETLLK